MEDDLQLKHPEGQGYMTIEPAITPGVGRSRTWLDPGKYPVTSVIPIIDRLLDGAAQSRLVIGFDNRSSKIVEKPDQLLGIMDVSEVRYLSVFVRYSDGSIVTGKPLNSPLPGYLWCDMASEAREAEKEETPEPEGRGRRKARRSTYSFRRGDDFIRDWRAMDKASRNPLTRKIKYFWSGPAAIIAALFGAALVLGFGGLLILTVIGHFLNAIAEGLPAASTPGPPLAAPESPSWDLGTWPPSAKTIGTAVVVCLEGSFFGSAFFPLLHPSQFFATRFQKEKLADAAEAKPHDRQLKIRSAAAKILRDVLIAIAGAALGGYIIYLMHWYP